MGVRGYTVVVTWYNAHNQRTSSRAWYTNRIRSRNSHASLQAAKSVIAQREFPDVTDNVSVASARRRSFITGFVTQHLTSLDYSLTVDCLLQYRTCERIGQASYNAATWADHKARRLGRRATDLSLNLNIKIRAISDIPIAYRVHSLVFYSQLFSFSNPFKDVAQHGPLPLLRGEPVSWQRQPRSAERDSD